jgi:hypothetical protein
MDGAGGYRPDNRSGAMHSGKPKIRDIHYRAGGQSFYIRLGTGDRWRRATAGYGRRFAVPFRGTPHRRKQFSVKRSLGSLREETNPDPNTRNPDTGPALNLAYGRKFPPKGEWSGSAARQGGWKRELFAAGIFVERRD